MFIGQTLEGKSESESIVRNRDVEGMCELSRKISLIENIKFKQALDVCISIAQQNPR